MFGIKPERINVDNIWIKLIFFHKEIDWIVTKKHIFAEYIQLLCGVGEE